MLQKSKIEEPEEQNLWLTSGLSCSHAYSHIHTHTQAHTHNREKQDTQITAFFMILFLGKGKFIEARDLWR